MVPAFRVPLTIVGGLVFVALTALAARADKPRGGSEIRLAVVEEPLETDADIRPVPAVAIDVDAPPQPAAFVESAVETPPAKPAPIKPFPRPKSAPSAARYQASAPVINNQIRPALNFYGGNPARATLSQFPARSPIQAGPQQPMQRQIKPFNAIYREPTISPYMNLYREENDAEGAPNYFAFVRPQMEQNAANRAQHDELQRLTRQVQGRGRAPAAPQQYQSTATSGRSTPARYMDTAQFYGGWSR